LLNLNWEHPNSGPNTGKSGFNPFNPSTWTKPNAIAQPLDAPAPKRSKHGAADEKKPGVDGNEAALAAAGENDEQSLATLVALVTSATEKNSFVPSVL
jgi:hypothetical protein